MANKRKNERYDCLVPVDSKSGDVFDRTQSIDISKGGIGFISRQKIPVNRRIPIELDLEEDKDPVLVIGKVCWAKNIAGTDQYRIGVIFEDILEGSQSRLNKYFRK